MSDPVTDPGKIKGAAFRQLIVWWDQTHGKADVLRALEQARKIAVDRTLSDDREALGILPSVWYPAPLVHALLDSLLGAVDDETQKALAFAAADSVMTATLTGVYKAVFMALASPQRWATHIQRIWSMHYDSGIVRIDEPEPRLHVNHFTEWRAHHPFICKLNMASGRPTYTAMGCKDVEVQMLTCISHGASECTSTVRWK